MPQKNAVRDATHCPMYKLNAESLFMIQHVNIEPQSVSIFVTTYFLSFSELALDSGTALTSTVQKCIKTIFKKFVVEIGVRQIRTIYSCLYYRTLMHQPNYSNQSAPNFLMTKFSKYLHRQFQGAETLRTSKLQLMFALCVYIYISSQMVLVLISKLAHFQLILINPQFCIHLYT